MKCRVLILLSGYTFGQNPTVYLVLVGPDFRPADRPSSACHRKQPHKSFRLLGC